MSNKHTIFGFIRIALLYTALISIVVSCSGGGGANQASPGGIAVLSIQPSESAIGVSLNSTIVVTFSESVDPSTVNASTFLVTDAQGRSVSGTISLTSGSIATFVPSTRMDPTTTYTVTITSGVHSLSGKPLPANYTWSFTTGMVSASQDTTPPTVISTDPANGATNVSITSALVATFSEALDSATVNTATFTVKDGANTPVSGTVVLTGETALFLPSAALAPLATFTATITTGVKDLAGNAMAGNYTWGLTTAAAPANLSPFGFHPAKTDLPGHPHDYTDAQAIGVTWARGELYAFWSLVQPDLTTQTYNFVPFDVEYGSIPQGISPLGNIAVEPPGSTGYEVTGSYLPVDEAKYSAFVQALVKRYSTQGPDSMPGLTNPVKYWQVENEPFDTQTTSFADVQRITYLAVKAACPDCTVLIGGVGGFPPVSRYLKAFDLGYKPILDALHGQYVDVMDFHWYGQATGDYRGAGDAYNHIRTVLDADGFTSVPIWMTEMTAFSGTIVSSGTSSTPTYPSQTERQQALDYVKRYVYPLSLGVKVIFAGFGVMDGFKYDGDYFDYTGLIYDSAVPGDLTTGQKKLGYYSYRKMTEKLEGSDWNSTATVQQANDVYVYRFTKNGKAIYVAWWDYFNDPTYTSGKVRAVTISGLNSATVTVTEALPKFATGAEVTAAGYANSFTVTTVAVSAGSVTLNLGDSPVYVELP